MQMQVGSGWFKEGKEKEKEKEKEKDKENLVLAAYSSMYISSVSHNNSFNQSFKLAPLAPLSECCTSVGNGDATSIESAGQNLSIKVGCVCQRAPPAPFRATKAEKLGLCQHYIVV